MKTNRQSKNQKCCPKFDPALWDGKIFTWENKKFIKDKVLTLFYIPMNFGVVVKRMMAKIEKVGASAQDWMGLSGHTSKWNMDLYVAVDREIPGAENTVMSGKFLSKAYEGDFKDTGKWRKDFDGYAQGRGVTVQKIYIWYTTCPKCAGIFSKIGSDFN